MLSTYQILEWDSAFFGFLVAKILPTSLSVETLEKVLRSMKDDGVTLAYWSTDPEDGVANEASRQCKGYLADEKVTFAITARDIRRQGMISCDLLVEQFAGTTATPELESLAIQAGRFSRFKLDPHMPKDSFIDLYRMWIRNSVNGKLAEAVFVVRDAGEIVGMATVGKKDGRADIGLLAVDSSMRGKNIGMALVNKAQQWGLDKNLQVSQVVTQQSNIPACRFYEKCGYHIDKVENIYHFWSNA